MVVDKFGRQYLSGDTNGRDKQGPRGIGFKLTSDGDFNVENKKIVNLANPLNELDAVNRQSTLIVESGTVSMRKRRLIELASPLDDSDAITKKYAKDLLKTVEINEKIKACPRRIGECERAIKELAAQNLLIFNTLKAIHPLLKNTITLLSHLYKHTNKTMTNQYALNTQDLDILFRTILTTDTVKIEKIKVKKGESATFIEEIDKDENDQ